MQLNKYNLGDVVMVQGKVQKIILNTNGTVTYGVTFPEDTDDIYCDAANVPEELITTVF